MLVLESQIDKSKISSFARILFPGHIELVNTLKEAEKAPNGSNIIVIFPDGSERYLSQNIYHYNACQNMVD